MKARKRNIDNATVMDATHWAQERVKGVEKHHLQFQTDPEKVKRVEAQECMVCYYYTGRIGGSAMTTAECGLCETTKTFGNTCVDVLCEECAKKHNLCIHCGGDMDMKQRRKQRF